MLRKNLRKNGDDPIGDDDTHELTKDQIDALLAKGDPEAAGVVHAAIEEFSQELDAVIRRYLKTKAWRDTERIVIGGGLRDSRVGELIIGRVSVMLKTAKVDIDVRADPPSSRRSRPDRSRRILRRPGCSRGTTRSLRSTSAAPTSGWA